MLNSPGTWLRNKNSRKLTSKLSNQHLDRFIPNRQDVASSQYLLNRTVSSLNNDDTGTGNANITSTLPDSCDLTYQGEVARACGIAMDQRILSFKKSRPVSSAEKELSARYLNKPGRGKGVHARRKIPTVPERVLDAPGIVDDYYLNLLDWSSQNVLAVSLGPTVYLWNAVSGTTDEVFTTDDEDSISSISWASDGAHLAVGDLKGQTHLINVSTQKRVRILPSLNRQVASALARIGSLSWNKTLLTTGSSSGAITHHDVRLPRSVTAEVCGHHTGEIVGLKWNHEGTALASGGNDNMMNVWDVKNTRTPKFSSQDHQGAVKALAWCPWQSGLLATGGGAVDRKINIWNTLNGSRAGSVDTGSQVTALHWSKTYKELVSSHGFNGTQQGESESKNQLMVWKYPTLTKVLELPHAHESRILHMTLSPDGQTVCTGAADENLKFWKLFAYDPTSVKTKGTRKALPGMAGAEDASKISPDFGGGSVR